VGKRKELGERRRGGEEHAFKAISIGSRVRRVLRCGMLKGKRLGQIRSTWGDHPYNTEKGELGTYAASMLKAARHFGASITECVA